MYASSVYVAPSAPVDNSAKFAHRCDGRLANAKNKSRLFSRLIATVCANRICSNASHASAGTAD